MDEERIKTLVAVAGQYLRREYPLEATGLTAVIVEKLEQVRLADEARRADCGKTPKGLRGRQ